MLPKQSVHVTDIEGNEKADTAANTMCTLPLRVTTSHVEEWIMEVTPLISVDWHMSLTAQPMSNKLRSVKPTVFLWVSATSTQSSQHHKCSSSPTN